MENIIENLIFEPVISYFSYGNETQICRTTYKGVIITWRTFFPFNIFKDPTDYFIVDRIIPNTCVVNNGVINENCYTEDGFGLPEFKTLEDAIAYLDIN